MNRILSTSVFGRESETSLRRRCPGERGQSIVEVAFALPVLLLLLVLVVDVARAFDASIVLVNAAREGARFGSLANPLEPAQIRNLVYQDVIGSGTNISHMEDFDQSNVVLLESTEAVTVTVSYDFPLWFGGLVGIDTFHLERQTVMPRRTDITEP